jgi:hypothetical protein
LEKKLKNPEWAWPNFSKREEGKKRRKKNPIKSLLGDPKQLATP